MNYCPYCMDPLDEHNGTCQCGAKTAEAIPVHHLKPGTKLQNKYLVGCALGEGGFGITYIGRDTTLDMRVAIKEYYPHGYSNRNHNYASDIVLSRGEAGLDFETEMQRFLNEARTMARFSNERGIVSVRDHFRENGTAYIVMEYLDGITLKNYLQTHGKFPPQELITLLDPVMASLCRIHKEGLIHRDISPDNIMLMPDGSLKLLDFGAARSVCGDKSLSVVLKPGYAPEEQYRTKGHQGAWTDVYALCATIYKCITGITPDESLERSYQDTLQPPSELGISITEAQEAALMNGLQIRAKDRIQSVDILRAALQKDSVKKEDPLSGIRSIRVSTGADADQENTRYGTAANNGKQSETDDEKTVLNNQNNDRTGSRGKRKPDDRGKRKPDNKDKRKPDNKGTRKPGSRRLPIVIAAVAVILLAALLSSLFLKKRNPLEVVSLVPGNDSYSITAAGQIEDATRSLWIGDDLLQVPLEENDNFYLLTAKGKQVSDKEFCKAEYLGHGLYVAFEHTEDPNCAYLFDRDGNDLLNTPVSLIKWPYEEEDYGSRYLVVYVAGDETVSTTDFLLCKTENGVYTSYVTGGRNYYGQIQVFDLETGTFVPNLPQLSQYYDLQICGDSLLIGSYSTGYSLYSPEGSVLLELSGHVSVGEGFLIASQGETHRVYDENGQQTYYVNRGLEAVSDSPYIRTWQNEQPTLIDCFGNPVLSVAADNLYAAADEVFVVHNGKYSGLIRKDGSEYAPCIYDNVYPIGNGYFYGRRGKIHTLISPEGIIATDLTYTDVYNLAAVKDQKMLVLNSHEFALSVPDTRYFNLAPALIALESEATGLYGAYDLYTGTQLLRQEYETIKYAADHVYAYKNGVWEVYELTFSSGPVSE